MPFADIASQQMPGPPMLILVPILLPAAVALILLVQHRRQPLAPGRRLAVVCAGAPMVVLGPLLPMLRPDLLPDRQPLTLPLLPNMDLAWRISHWIPLLVLSLLWIATTLGCERLEGRLPKDVIVRLEAGLGLVVGAAACAALAANALTLFLGIGLTVLCLGRLAAIRMPYRGSRRLLPAKGLRALGALSASLDKGLDKTWTATAQLTIRLGRGCLGLDRLPLRVQLALTFTCVALALLCLHLLLVSRGPV